MRCSSSALPRLRPSDETVDPGFSGWQQETWLFHCADAAAYLGRVGWDELQATPDALDSLRAELRPLRLDAASIDEQLQWLDRDGDHTAHLFRCRHCGRHLACSDSL